eukprot:g30338.t1
MAKLYCKSLIALENVVMSYLLVPLQTLGYSGENIRILTQQHRGNSDKFLSQDGVGFEGEDGAAVGKVIDETGEDGWAKDTTLTNSYRDVLELRDGESKTRGHRFKVSGERFKKDLRGNFFTQRLVRIWNGLLEKGVEA